jgi:hypothetical protein
MQKQSILALKRAGWPDKLSEGERVARDIIWKKEIKEIGTPEDMKKQDAEIRGHYVELCHNTTDCLEALDRAYCAVGKTYFKKASGGGIDEAEYDAWIKARGVGQTDDDLKKIKNDNRFVKNLFFNNEAWQKWVEDDLFKKLGDAYKKHDEIKKKYVGSRDAKVEVEGDYLLAILLKLAQTYSGEIYGRNKLQVPDSLRAPKEMAGGSLESSVAVSRGHFEGHRKVLLERLGLSNWDPSKKDDPKKDEPKKDEPKKDDPNKK